jgi:hypothetical protein
MGQVGHAGNPGKCCVAPSAFGSINTSTYGPKPVRQGQPPGYWKDRPKEWPNNSDKQAFHRYFMCGPEFRYYKATMYEVCTTQYSDWFEGAELCSRLVAAYLNSKRGWTPFLKEETIQAIFTECFTKGSFSPTAGVNWSRAQCIEYLRATQEA